MSYPKDLTAFFKQYQTTTSKSVTIAAVKDDYKCASFEQSLDAVNTLVQFQNSRMKKKPHKYLELGFYNQICSGLANFLLDEKKEKEQLKEQLKELLKLQAKVQEKQEEKETAVSNESFKVSMEQKIKILEAKMKQYETKMDNQNATMKLTSQTKTDQDVRKLCEKKCTKRKPKMFYEDNEFGLNSDSDSDLEEFLLNVAKKPKTTKDEDEESEDNNDEENDDNTEDEENEELYQNNQGEERKKRLTTRIDKVGQPGLKESGDFLDVSGNSKGGRGRGNNRGRGSAASSGAGSRTRARGRV